MKERPIIFSGEMVRAILDGRKTQTRRVIKPQPDHIHTFQKGILLPQIGDKEIRCPYGQPGDRLWVRETWAKNNPVLDAKVCYRADLMSPDLGKPWKPSIYMPRWASRITLEIVNVRVERVQEITEADVIAEGIGAFTLARGVLSDAPPDPRWKFIELWNSINANRGYGWEINPWVWVIEFKVL